MRTIALLAVVIGPAVLIRGFFSEIGLVYTAGMAIVGALFLIDILLRRF